MSSWSSGRTPSRSFAEAPDGVSREHYDQAVREVLSYERKAADLTARLREAADERDRERARREGAEAKLAAAEQARDDAAAAAARYADALELAVLDIAVLRTQVEKLAAAAMEGTWITRIAAGFASIAAVVSVASYLARAAERAKSTAPDVAPNPPAGETHDA